VRSLCWFPDDSKRYRQLQHQPPKILGSHLIDLNHLQPCGNQPLIDLSGFQAYVTFSTNRSFAGLGDMVQNPLCWMTNGTVGHRKTTKLTSEWLASLYFLFPIVPFAIQLDGFCTMWPSHAKGQLERKPNIIA